MNQRLALARLKKRVAKLGVMVLEADKGKRFVIVDESTYVQMSRDHVTKDRVIEPEDVSCAQRIMSTTAKALVTILGVGKSQSTKNSVRCHDNAGSAAEDAPTLTLLPKVHKDPHPDGHPQSWPVVAAASGLTSRAGDVLADFLGPIIHLDTPRQEDKSMEEAIAQLGEAQSAIISTGARSVMVGSLNVNALYPSLDQGEAADMVAQLIMRSRTKITGVDYRAAQVFLASNLSPNEIKEEGLRGLLPDRMWKMGKRPGPTTTELAAKGPKDPWGGRIGAGGHMPTAQAQPQGGSSPQGLRGEQHPPQPQSKQATTRWRMTNPDRDLSEYQKRFILAKVVKVAVRSVFANHVYRFMGVIYLQLEGGPIGLRLTSIVARVVMDHWASMFLTSLQDSGIKVWAMIKYVDDVNIVLDILEAGWRWSGGCLEWRDEWLTADMESGQSQEERSMEVVRSAAEDVVGWLHFTIDLPDMHNNGKVPMLDLEVWVDHREVEEGQEPRADVLTWNFYEKPSASARVLRATSAYSWRSKIVCMNMEVFRRHRNTSRQASLVHRLGIIQKFVCKLRLSGYCRASVDRMVEEGGRFYYRRLRVDLEGGPPLNNRSEENLVMGRRDKMGDSETWFCRRRGGNKERLRKQHGWRAVEEPEVATGGDNNTTTSRGKPGRWRRTRGQGPRTQTPGMEPHGPPPQSLQTFGQEGREGPEATIQVPFTNRSRLKDLVQAAEDDYNQLVGCRKVRVVEGGGDKLIHVLSKTDPWSAKYYCSDPICKTCTSRQWIKEQQKLAKKDKTLVPEFMVKPGSGLCRREGINYSLQCLPCLSNGVDTRYQVNELQIWEAEAWGTPIHPGLWLHFQPSCHACCGAAWGDQATVLGCDYQN